eukprot:CAMPEP_0197829882 /NCGR_PEP_ID=MMETSP1437-20131217/6435_1 /TAXON_ID=49252 ORGANISM="Eucampia antarctica, Strain CCMP1452" /NCGR_SAMPLE_ID=MMETSP1437 /ASSEMBLY_ACC=CAM_ASM_001096 /LENGTH=73 /DNA_ID=CAMNT_0043431889 /DNA_START=62 /DNA_END=280 /DNA_ORIENTATION=+
MGINKTLFKHNYHVVLSLKVVAFDVGVGMVQDDGRRDPKGLLKARVGVHPMKSRVGVLVEAIALEIFGLDVGI